MPLGKRLVLPRKMSATWLLSKAVIWLSAETTATTSALTSVLLRLSASPMTTNVLYLRMFMIISSPHEIEGDANQIHATATLKVRLQISQHARGPIVQANVI